MDTFSIESSPVLSDAEVAEINAKAAFASDHLFHAPALTIVHYDIRQRMSIAGLVEGNNGLYSITEGNRMKVSCILDFFPEHLAFI